MRPKGEGPPERGNPQEPDALAGEVQGGSDELGRLPARVERLSTAKRRTLENLSHLEGISTWAVNLDSYRSRLRNCGCYLAFRNYHTIGSVRLSGAIFCQLPLLCPFCAIRRASKALTVYLARYRTIIEENPNLKFSHVTMTVKNGPDLDERFDHLSASIKEIFRRRMRSLSGSRDVTEWVKAHAVVGSYEFTNKGKGWHPHVHMCVLHEGRFDFDAMRQEWQRITGDSHVFRVEPAQHPEDPAQDFLEVFKYALKFSDLTPAQCVHAWLTLRGRRLMFSIGGFRGVVVPDHLLDDLPTEDLPYFELLYRFRSGHYQLEKTHEYTPS